MRFHHMCIVTPDIDKQIEMWRDLMGFRIAYKGEIPDGEEYLPTVMAPRKLVEDLYKVPGASATVAVMLSEEGAMMELLQPHVPDVKLTPIEKLGYADSGFHELGIVTTKIDAFFEKVRSMGYKTQTEYVWASGSLGRSFMFHDPDGNLIQMWEHADTVPAEFETRAA
jgi:catechol 2,3-dioxygenase-like lactoylglutathione lyase family enzyme